jgi:ribose transport system permease protein
MPRLPRLATGLATVLVVLLLLLVLLAFVGPAYSSPSGYIALLKRSAPLMILAIGQYFVIVAGEFDLSVGSLVTAEVVIADRLIDGDPSRTWPVIALLVGFGALVGLVNGLLTTKLKVPSFIVTLGMLLVLEGAVFLWTGGAPRGALTQEFRRFGRAALGTEGFLAQIPYAVVILAVVAVAAVLFMRSGTGRTLMATGDNDTAVRLAGGRVDALRIGAFVLSGLLAALAAILLGGYSGVSAQVGRGLEFEAITAVVLGGVVLGGDHRGRARRGRARRRARLGDRRDGRRADPAGAVRHAQPARRVRRTGVDRAGRDHHRPRRVRVVRGRAARPADPKTGVERYRRTTQERPHRGPSPERCL